MQPIEIKGAKIIDTDLLKTSGIARIVIELTEQDSMQYYGAFSVAEVTKLISDVKFNFTELEGNEQIVQDNIDIDRPDYAAFRRLCIEYSGEEYYKRLKEHLGVEHMSDLEQRYSPSIIKDLLLQQSHTIDCNMGRIWDLDVTALTHKDDAYKLWQQLFNRFNNSKQYNEIIF